MRILPLLAAILLSTICVAHPPWGIAVDGKGNIYFTDILHNGRGTLWKLTPEGTLISLRKDFHSHNVTLDLKGNLYASHGEEFQYLLRISPYGKVDTIASSPDFKRFHGGNCTVSPMGHIYFGIDHHIWEYMPNGKRRKLNSEPLGWNQTIMADRSGNVYAPDLNQGNGTLLKITPDGSSSIVATDLISELDRPKDRHNDVLLGMAEDMDGNIYICETAGRRIVKIIGQHTETFYRSDDGWTPSAICFAQGSTYILEWGGTNKGPQIIKLTSDGTKTLIFNFEEHARK